MRNNIFYFALSLPPSTLIRKSVSFPWKKFRQWLMHVKDRTRSSFASDFPKGPLYRYFRAPDISQFNTVRKTLIGITDHYLEHRFDLLGSGWVRVAYGIPCRGLEGYLYEMGQEVDTDPTGNWLKGRINEANLPMAESIWNSVNNGYAPIDWQLDFKSGYRWSEKTWYQNIDLGPQHGVDIKVPWELARMQHLPQMVLAYLLVKAAADEKQVDLEIEETGEAGKCINAPEVYVQEFRNQVIDFMATNPPRFGVNWYYAMEAGIRVVNWLVAYDFFRTSGVKFDSEFEATFIKSVYEHGLHIVNNWEWNKEFRSNHYLANIVGLLFVSAYLKRTPQTDAWLSFSVQELIREAKIQFWDDGGNYEASTSYHRLSAEMVIYATALVLGLPEEKKAALKEYDHSLIKRKPGLLPCPMPFYPLPSIATLVVRSEGLSYQHESPFPKWYFERIEKMAEFTMHITKANNKIPQIGDNDSGRFLKLSPLYENLVVREAKEKYRNLEGYDELPDDGIYWDESFLDHRHLVSAVNGLFDRQDFEDFAGTDWLENVLIHNLSGGRKIKSYKGPDEAPSAEKIRLGTEDEWMRIQRECDALSGYVSKTTDIPVQGEDIKVGLRLYGYPDFGLYIFKSERFYLLIRCGPAGQNGIGGHAHNDQLSIEFNVDGKDRILDPGTYLYMPLPEYRNAYRSVNAHFAPQVNDGCEPGRLDLGLFQLGDEARAECLYFGLNGFAGLHWGYGEPVYRVVKLLEHKIRIVDCVKKDLRSKGASKRVFRSEKTAQAIGFSKSYGVRTQQARQ